MVKSCFSVTGVTIPFVVRVQGVYGRDDGLETVWRFVEKLEKVTLWWGLYWTHTLVMRVVDGILQVAEDDGFDMWVLCVYVS